MVQAAAAKMGNDLQVSADQVNWRRCEPYGSPAAAAVWVQSEWRRPVRKTAAAGESDETDENDAASLTREVSFSEHTEGVANKARELAHLCGLIPQAMAAVGAAAELHDIGKWDDRLQFMLNPNRDPNLEPLAKGKWCSVREWRQRREAIGYPKNWRHEFASVAIAAARSSWAEDCDRELALYLIGTHHGYGRPFPPVWSDDERYQVRARIDGETVTATRVHELASLDSGWVDRFWALTRQYGWWGLAHLEAILRRADCVRSREEQEDRN